MGDLFCGMRPFNPYFLYFSFQSYIVLLPNVSIVGVSPCLYKKSSIALRSRAIVLLVWRACSKCITAVRNFIELNLFSYCILGSP